MEETLEFKIKDILINSIPKYYSNIDIFSIGRKLGISKELYYSDGFTLYRLSEEFIDVVYKRGFENKLLEIINSDKDLSRHMIIENINKFKMITEEQQGIVQDFNPKLILNLSDIHISSEEDVSRYLLQLKTDLKSTKKIKEMDYIILSGDITNKASKEEFKLAKNFITEISKSLNIKNENIIIVPGNHDLDWNYCKQAVDDEGNILDKDLYNEKFKNFNEYFYKPVCNREYSLDPSNQYEIKIYDNDKLIFLELNSSWKIDHINKYRSSININALSNGLAILLEDDNYDDYIKIAVFHHPVLGKDQMNNDFLDILIAQGFKICFHGHIHKASYDFSKYDDNLGINVIGSGTFGAPTHEQVAGIPLQYNIIRLYNNEVEVESRKKEKVNGTWSADARWGNKENPISTYKIKL